MVATPIDQLIERLAAGPLGPRLRRQHPLGPMTTYRVGGAADVFVSVRSRQDIDDLLGALATVDIDVLVVGRGSNLLVADRGFRGLAVGVLDGLDDVSIDGCAVTAEAGVALPRLARATVGAGLTGMEWAVGVPGSVGGAVRMNAGGHGGDMAAVVRSATVADLRSGQIRAWPAVELQFGYRTSAVRSHHLVVDAVCELAVGDVAVGEAELADIVRWRRDHQPGGQNAGSVFTNPPGDSAGRLIDAAGGKGMRVGTAAVSTKHANFIQADPGGSADDVHALMAAVRRLVSEHHGVDLAVETRLVGFEGEPW